MVHKLTNLADFVLHYCSFHFSIDGWHSQHKAFWCESNKNILPFCAFMLQLQGSQFQTVTDFYVKYAFSNY